MLSIVCETAAKYLKFSGRFCYILTPVLCRLSTACSVLISICVNVTEVLVVNWMWRHNETSEHFGFVADVELMFYWAVSYSSAWVIAFIRRWKQFLLCAFWWTFHWMQKLLNVQFKRQLLQTVECGSIEYISFVGMSNTTDAFEHSFRFVENCWTREKKHEIFYWIESFFSLRVCARSDGC